MPAAALVGGQDRSGRGTARLVVREGFVMRHPDMRRVALFIPYHWNLPTFASGKAAKRSGRE